MDDKKVLKALETVKTMFHNRGYTKITETKIENTDIQILKARDKEGFRVCYFILPCEKLDSNQIRNYAGLLINSVKSKHGIIAYISKTHVVEDIIKQTNISYKLEMELFEFDKLQFTIIDNVLVPKHYLETEVDDRLKKIKDKLPVLLRTDPIVRYYNFRHGDFIRVVRHDGSIAYRLVA